MISHLDNIIRQAVRRSAALEGNNLDRAMKNKKVIQDIKKAKSK